MHEVFLIFPLRIFVLSLTAHIACVVLGDGHISHVPIDKQIADRLAHVIVSDGLAENMGY